jgi:hypothetical protein
LSILIFIFKFFGILIEVVVAAFLLSDDVSPEGVSVAEWTVSVNRKKEIRVSGLPDIRVSSLPEMVGQTDEVVDAGTPES